MSELDPVIRGETLWKHITQLFSAEFVSTLSFSNRVWSDLYLPHSKNRPDSVPILPNANPTERIHWPDSDPTLTAISGRNLDSIDKKRQYQFISNHARPSGQHSDPQDTFQTPSWQHRTLFRFWSDTVEPVTI